MKSKREIKVINAAKPQENVMMDYDMIPDKDRLNEYIIGEKLNLTDSRYKKLISEYYQNLQSGV